MVCAGELWMCVCGLVSCFLFLVSDVPFVRHWRVCLSGRRDGDDY